MAIDFAKGLADNQDASIVIHKVDGSIRKQDYSEKILAFSAKDLAL